MRQQLMMFTLLLLTWAPLANAKEAKNEGSYYTYAQLRVKQKVVTDGKIQLIFDPVQEQFHWCPGIKVQETKKATIATFVRCPTSKSCSIDEKAKIGRRMIRSVTIDIRGKNVYVRNGAKKYKLLHKVEKTQPKGTSAQSGKG